LNNNDLLQRICDVFKLDIEKINTIYDRTGQKADRDLISKWMEKKEDENMIECSDENLGHFLNGFIIEKRGRKDGPLPVAEKQINNNNIFMKLKIALDLKADDVLDIMELGQYNTTPNELSSFFRKPGNKHYRKCRDEVLLAFLNGLKIKYGS
jgi:uncharacterized protein YehS (DUF1456 family)